MTTFVCLHFLSTSRWGNGREVSTLVYSARLLSEMAARNCAAGAEGVKPRHSFFVCLFVFCCFFSCFLFVCLSLGVTRFEIACFLIV